MARVKADLKTLAARERVLRDQLRALKKQWRAIERVALRARTERVAALAEKFGILHIPDTVLAATFKKLAAENPPSTESVEDSDTVTAAGETAQADSAGSEGRKRWPFSD